MFGNRPRLAAYQDQGRILRSVLIKPRSESYVTEIRAGLEELAG